ncbi:hypothetical protein MalM25_09330 [Planctomycetes bacterium MalM25]|nr:hypothetical protein MalM25_09330 [Planctomycetes bacterium MalM25]
MDSVLDPKLIFSALSFVFTAYFWLVKARKERPNLQFHQLSSFRLSSRRHPTKAGWKRHCLQQIESGGVLAVNHSTRQNSIILFDCFLMTERGVVEGDWGYSGDDKPPWNFGPETTIALSPAFFFDLPEGTAMPADPEFHAHFITASGTTFSHRFTLEAPQRRSSEPPVARAA